MLVAEAEAEEAIREESWDVKARVLEEEISLATERDLGRWPYRWASFADIVVCCGEMYVSEIYGKVEQ